MESEGGKLLAILIVSILIKGSIVSQQKKTLRVDLNALDTT